MSLLASNAECEHRRLHDVEAPPRRKKRRHRWLVPPPSVLVAGRQRWFSMETRTPQMIATTEEEAKLEAVRRTTAEMAPERSPLEAEKGSVKQLQRVVTGQRGDLGCEWANASRVALRNSSKRSGVAGVAVRRRPAVIDHLQVVHRPVDDGVDGGLRIRRH